MAIETTDGTLESYGDDRKTLTHLVIRLIVRAQRRERRKHGRRWAVGGDHDFVMHVNVPFHKQTGFKPVYPLAINSLRKNIFL